MDGVFYDSDSSEHAEDLEGFLFSAWMTAGAAATAQAELAPRTTGDDKPTAGRSKSGLSGGGSSSGGGGGGRGGRGDSGSSGVSGDGNASSNGSGSGAGGAGRGGVGGGGPGSSGFSGGDGGAGEGGSGDGEASSGGAAAGVGSSAGDGNRIFTDAEWAAMSSTKRKRWNQEKTLRSQMRVAPPLNPSGLAERPGTFRGIKRKRKPLGWRALAPCVTSPHPETDRLEAKQLLMCMLSKRVEELRQKPKRHPLPCSSNRDEQKHLEQF